MQIHYNIDNLPEFRNAVVTIGTFDGVHMGHRQIIEKLVHEASKTGGESVIISFHPHPRKIVSSTILGIRLINTVEEKIELLSGLGIDHLVIVPFTEVFANQQAEDYIKDFLVANFHPHMIIIGYDHRFGRDRQGDYRLLEKLAPEFGYIITEIPKHIIDEISISSTNIREAILHGDIKTANKLLGYDFYFEGEVVHGDKRGRELGYPTANLKINDPEKIIPGDGIYAVYAELKEVAKKDHPIARLVPKKKRVELMKGMMSIGFRPTVDGTKRVVEVNIFDFTEFIYGQSLRVYVKQYLRPEFKFNSITELVDQMGKDRVESLAVL